MVNLETTQDKVEEVEEVEEVQEEPKKKRGRPKKPEEEKVVKTTEPKRNRGRPRNPESVFNNVETKKEYHKPYFLEKLKDQAICPVCDKNLNSIIALKHHYKHNTKCQLIRYKQDVKTLLAIMPNVLEHL